MNIIMNSSIQIVILSLFVLQLFLTTIQIMINLNSKSNGLTNERRESDDSIEDFSKNCKKYFLTSREIEILKLISDGLPYKIIAAQLHISENTVGTHVKNMFSKVKATNKMELVSRVASFK